MTIIFDTYKKEMLSIALPISLSFNIRTVGNIRQCQILVLPHNILCDRMNVSRELMTYKCDYHCDYWEDNCNHYLDY